MHVRAQALELDARNCDALVARGAALANQRSFAAAAADFEAALGAPSSPPFPVRLRAALACHAVFNATTAFKCPFSFAMRRISQPSSCSWDGYARRFVSDNCLHM